MSVGGTAGDGGKARGVRIIRARGKMSPDRVSHGGLHRLFRHGLACGVDCGFPILDELSHRVLEAGQGTLVAVGVAGGGVVGLVGTRRRCAAPSSNDSTPETSTPAMRTRTVGRRQGH